MLLVGTTSHLTLFSSGALPEDCRDHIPQSRYIPGIYMVYTMQNTGKMLIEVPMTGI
jgi:hypothetical protein